MRVVIHPEAEQELEEAALWYEERQSGLGDEFLNAFEAILRRVVSEPARWRFFQKENRKLNFRRFHYAIVYSLKGEFLYVKAVMHLHRRPGYWKHRKFS